MNKNYLTLIIATIMLFSMGSAYAALGIGSWVVNDNTSLGINVGQDAEFRYGVTAVTSLNGKYSIMLYREGNSNPIFKYAENLATVGNGALGKFTVTPANYGNTAGSYYISITSSDDYGSHSYKLNLAIVSNNPNTITISCGVNPSTGYSPLNTQFSSTVIGGTGVYTYNWTFGDGSTDNTKTATSHLYSTGSYNTALTVVDSANNTATAVCGQVVVTAITPPNALKTSCAATPLVGTAPFNVSIYSQTSGGTGPYTYEWTYGDGSVKTGVYSTVLAYAYNEVGVYPISLRVFDANNNIAQATCGIVNAVAPIIPVAPLNATCSVTPTNGNVSLTVQTQAQTTGGSGTYSYTWSFGDSPNVTLPLTTDKNITYSHTYTTANTYDVSLKITDTGSRTLTVPCGQVVVNNVTIPPVPLNVSCSADVINGTIPLNVTFTSNVTGGTGPYQYLWTFGDGPLGNIIGSVSYMYTAVGTFNSTLRITDFANNVVTASCGQITVNNITPPLNNTNITATCNANPLTGTDSLQVNFTSTATGGDGIYSYFWVFGDGSTINGSSTAAHVYNTGNYTAQLVVSDNSFGATIVNCGNISITGNVTPPLNNTNLTVSCNANPTSGTDPLQVNFTSTATGGTGPYTYSWIFGDNNTITGANTAAHVYNSGTYAPTLVVTDSTSTIVAASCGQITVNNNNVTPPNGTNMSVSCFAMPSSGTAPLMVLLNTVVSNGAAPYTFAYDYGNGTTSTDQNNIRLITYDAIGTYNPTVSVTGNNGVVENASCGLIIVSGNNGTNVLTANIGGPYIGYINEALTFNASASTGNIVRYTWDFGDGTIIDSVTPEVQHVYNKIDKYNVILTVYGIFGNSDSTNTIVTVVERTAPPIADANVARDLPDKGIVVKSLTLFGVNGGETLGPNDYLSAKINVKNEWDSKLKNVRVTLSIPELGLEARSTLFDFSRGSEHSETIVLPLYDVEPGVYYVRVEVHNDQGNDEARRIKYREIVVK